MKITIYPLGTNGFYPSFGRHTSSYLVCTKEHALLLDAGSGASRLREPFFIDLLEPYETLSVLFSHYHLDHITGLFPLSVTWGKGPLHLYTPAPPFVNANPDGILERLLYPPFARYDAERLKQRFVVHPVTEQVFDIAGFTCRCWVQEHPDGSLGYRFDDRFVYATDKTVRMEEVNHIRGVELLMHEVWLRDAEVPGNEHFLRDHSQLADVARLAREAGVARLVPTHHRPDWTEEDLAAMARELEEAAGIPVERPIEGQPLTPHGEAR